MPGAQSLAWWQKTAVNWECLSNHPEKEQGVGISGATMRQTCGR